METKKCSKCGEVKELGEFHKRAASRDGRQNRCKICARQQHKKYYQENKEKRRQYKKQHYQENEEKIKQCTKQYYQENKEKKKQYDKQYYQENKEKIKQYRQENKEKIRQCNKKYRKENGEKIKQYQKQYRQENKEKIRQCMKRRYHSDPLFRMISTYRRGLRGAFENIKQKKICKSLESLDTTWDHFHDHIAQQFQPGMTWDNFGEWHFDHIKPINLATNEQEVIELSHYTNFRPLWAEENLSRPKDGSDLTSPWPRTS